MPKTAEKPKKKVEIEIERRNGKTIFKFRVDPALTTYYSEIAKEVRESARWEGLSFFYLPQIIESPDYQNKLESRGLIDDFGSELIQNNKFNIAWVRTVNSCGEIKINDGISFADLSVMVRNATAFLKEHFEDHFRPFKIKGVVSLEVF
jgi:hypothetical protein